MAILGKTIVIVKSTPDEFYNSMTAHQERNGIKTENWARIGQASLTPAVGLAKSLALAYKVKRCVGRSHM